MKISKIFKSIIGIGAVSGIAYAAYKCGVDAGKSAERSRRIAEDLDFLDDDDDELEYDEPDDACLAPAEDRFHSIMDDIHGGKTEKHFVLMDDIHISGVTTEQIKSLIFRLATMKSFSVKTVRDFLDVDRKKAVEVIDTLISSGYVTRYNGYKYYCGSGFSAIEV